MPFSRANAEVEIKKQMSNARLPTFVLIRGAHAPSGAGFGASPEQSDKVRDSRKLSELPAREARALARQEPAFTLIELIVVIAIIAILVGLAFPVFQGVQNQAKKTQAKNDLVQIVTAVNAFYTEYGKYPIATTNNALTDAQAADLFYTLRAVDPGALHRADA